jgi:hypothetical protein
VFNQINPSKYILMDSKFKFRPCLQRFVEPSGGVIKHLDLDGWDWEAYSSLIKRRIVSRTSEPSSDVHSKLLFVGNFTEQESWKAEGVIAQLISFMYQNIFLYHFGRVKTLLWLQSPAWQPLVAPPGHGDRKKVSVLRELTCDARVIAASKLPEPGDAARKRAGSHPLEVDNLSDIIHLVKSDFQPQVCSHLNSGC